MPAAEREFRGEQIGGTILDGTSALFFGNDLPEELAFFDLPMWTFLASAILITAVAALLAVRRFVRLTT